MSEKGKGFSEAQVLGLEGPPKMSKNWSWQRKKRLSRALETFDKFQPGKIRQVGCFLAGANNYSHTGATANAQYFAYCSTLAVYAFSCRTRTLAAVLSQFEDNLSACVLSTVEPEVVATCTCTGLLQVWNVISCDLLAETRYDKADPPRLLVFDKVHPKVLHIATTRTVSKVGWQDKPEGAAETMPLNVLAGPFKVGSTHEVRTLSISTRNPALAIVGCTDAIFYVYEHQATKGRGDRPLGLGKPKKLGEITSEFADVQFDLLSPTYAVLCLKDGRMYLHDLEQGINMVSFSKQAVGNWRVCFLPKMPGTFVTVSERAGALHVWNVSQGQPLRSLRTGLPGISSVCLLEDSSVVVLTATDGSVICYDVETRRVAWDANAGHTDTIFHCALSNKDPDVLATCSFDRMVRIWNLRDMECTQVLPGAADVLYSVSWSPDDALIAAACFNGSVVLYDVKKGVAKRSLKVHQARCMKVAWHPTNQDLLCSAGNDRRCVVFRMDGSGVAEFTHAAAVIGCCWSPHGKDIIATIDHSGMVRVLDVGQVALVVKFPSMHQSTGFSVAWSPLVPDLILSTSSDGTARVWDVAKKVSVQCLEGHQDRVRAATWHPEVPYLAFTGSWDADIRVWDVRSGACLAAWSQHQADVYGISIHPKRPFVLCTCSRDTTTTVLSIDDMFTPIKVGALMGRSQQGVTDDVMKKGAPPQLCGPVGAHVGESPQLSPLELLERVADAMLPQNGSQALVELVRASVSPGNSGGSVVHSARVPHMSRVAEILNAQAQEVELLRSTTKMRGIGAASRRLEVLNKAARAHLLAGNIGQCADIMAELGRWEEALVMASLDSPEKWRSMVARRGQDLLDNGGTVDDVAPMFLASGDTSRLVSMLIAAERYSEAYSIAAMRQLGGYSVAPQVNPVTNRHSRTRSQPDMGAIDGLAQKLAKEKIGGDGEASPAREASAAEGSAASTSTRSPLPPSGRAVLPPLQRVGTAGRGGDLPPIRGQQAPAGGSPPPADAQQTPTAPPQPQPALSRKASALSRGQAGPISGRATAQLVAIQALQAQRFLMRLEPVWAACCMMSVGDAPSALVALLRGGETVLAWGVARAIQAPSVRFLALEVARICAGQAAELANELARDALGDGDASVPTMGLELDPVAQLAGGAIPAAGGAAAAGLESAAAEANAGGAPDDFEKCMRAAEEASRGGDVRGAVNAAARAAAAYLSGSPAGPGNGGLANLGCLLSSALGIPLLGSARTAAAAYRELGPSLHYPRQGIVPANVVSQAVPETQHAGDAAAALAYGSLAAVAACRAALDGYQALAEPLLEVALKCVREAEAAGASVPPELPSLLGTHALVLVADSSPHKAYAGLRRLLKDADTPRAAKALAEARMKALEPMVAALPVPIEAAMALHGVYDVGE